MYRSPHWKTRAALFLVFILVSTAAAFVPRLWVIAAIAISFLFGFFLRQGDLCGSSGFSEALLARDWRKVQSLWVCIVVSMVGFAILHLLGFVTPNVKPMLWLNCIVGGLLFGSGIMLAGPALSLPSVLLIRSAAPDEHI